LRYLGEGSEAVVPEVIGGRIISHIDAAAFRDASVSQVTVPHSVRTIISNTFTPETKVIWQGRYRFRGNTFLGYEGTRTAFTVPQEIAGRQITAIGSRAFANSNIITLTIPEGITTIGDYAFLNATNLRTIINYRIAGA